MGKLDEDGNSSVLTAKEILNSRHGSWSGSGLKGTEGIVRCALTFDGGDSGVDVPNHAILEVGTSDFSIEAWIRVAEAQVGTRTFLDMRSLPGVGYRALLVNGQLGCEINNGTTSHTTVSTTNIEEGLWHHVAMTVTRGVDTRLYVDGALAATHFSGSVSGSLSLGEELSIGRDNSTGSTGLIGSLDEVTLYHRALTPSEINSIRYAECAMKPRPTSRPDGVFVLGRPGREGGRLRASPSFAARSHAHSRISSFGMRSALSLRRRSRAPAVRGGAPTWRRQ